MEKKEINFTVNKDSKDIFRERIAKKLADIDFDPENRIKLPADRLNTLLFDYDEKKKCKKIGYTYGGLCKLDLSEISLDNVDLDNIFAVDLSNTNIVIDFSKIYMSDQINGVYISNINFSNIDLSGVSYSNKNKRYIFNGCTLINTNFEFPEIDSIFSNCDFRNNDFDGLDLCCNGGSGALLWDDIEFFNCNFSGTGASVHIGNYYKDDTYEPGAAYNQIGELVKKRYLDGCIVCDHFNKPLEQRKEEAIEIKDQYDKFISHYINETLDMIDSQLPSFGGKKLMNAKDKNGYYKISKTLKNLPTNSEEI